MFKKILDSVSWENTDEVRTIFREIWLIFLRRPGMIWHHIFQIINVKTFAFSLNSLMIFWHHCSYIYTILFCSILLLTNKVFFHNLCECIFFIVIIVNLVNVLIVFCLHFAIFVYSLITLNFSANSYPPHLKHYLLITLSHWQTCTTSVFFLLLLFMSS